MTDVSCHKPRNGGGCIRDDDFDAIYAHLRKNDTDIGDTLRAATSAEATSKATHGVVTAMADKLSELAVEIKAWTEAHERKHVQEKLAKMPSVDWELDEPTGVVDASGWADRARAEAVRNEQLAAELAAEKARREERDRQSERVRAEAASQQKTQLEKWKLVAGFVGTVLTSGGGAFLLAKMFGG